MANIVVTRSGTIGRVAYITQRFDDAIASDDLIRVRIPDERVRLYVYAYLQTEAALNQMLRNEYGSVQQHLEPIHISNILIPVPEDWSEADAVIKAAQEQIAIKEQMETVTKTLDDASHALLDKLTEQGETTPGEARTESTAEA